MNKRQRKKNWIIKCRVNIRKCMGGSNRFVKDMASLLYHKKDAIELMKVELGRCAVNKARTGQVVKIKFKADE